MPRSVSKINWISRGWHAVYFSASVLLGLRFKKDWIRTSPGHALGIRYFVYLVTFEWALGIGLYVLFAVLAKGHGLHQGPVGLLTRFEVPHQLRLSSARAQPQFHPQRPHQLQLQLQLQ